jgi:hypothetical protein
MAIPSTHANHIDTPERLFRSLIDIAKHHAPERSYAEPVGEFTDLIVNCLLEGRDVDEIKYPEDRPTLLTSLRERLSGRLGAEYVQPGNPVLVALAADLYGCGDPCLERANWMLLDLLHLNANGKGYFAQLHVTDSRGWTRHFLVSTTAFEREFDMRVRIPIAHTPLGYEVRLEMAGSFEDAPWSA